MDCIDLLTTPVEDAYAPGFATSRSACPHSARAVRWGMRILVLGGTVFLSRAVAEAAVARGHDVTCAARGVSGTVPDGATLVPWDRADAVPAELTWAPFDAVVDVSRIPSHVRRAVAAFPDAHWTFVSTVNVYADTATVGGTPATLPLLDPIETDEDPAPARTRTAP